MSYILYLHGFHSSPNSEKTTLFVNYIAEHHPELKVITPQLPCKPDEVVALLQALSEQYQFRGVIGSSLGGYLATYLHNQLRIPAVLINPAVRPFELLHDYLGPQTHPITGEDYELTQADMRLLKSLYQEQLAQPSKIWLLQQEKDEVLDYRQALDKYQNCKVTFELEGNHAFVGFERFLGAIVAFFDLAPS